MTSNSGEPPPTKEAKQSATDGEPPPAKKAKQSTTDGEPPPAKKAKQSVTRTSKRESFEEEINQIFFFFQGR